MARTATKSAFSLPSVKELGVPTKTGEPLSLHDLLGLSEMETVHEPNRRAQLVPWAPVLCQTMNGYGAVLVRHRLHHLVQRLSIMEL